jgi:putative regulatory protein, FmdB family
VPIFEYLCKSCNRIYSFLSFSASPQREPVCPKCGASPLTRVPSTFAVAGSQRKSAAEEKPQRGSEEAVPPALERELAALASSVDEKDMEDPRTMARLMRRLAEASGEPVPQTLEEMMRRMEAGEDPEKLEEELGDQLEAELGAEEEEEGFGASAPERDPGLYSF